VQGIGLQKSCDPPTWVFGSDVQIEMHEDKAKLLATAESRFHNIGSENNVLPWYNFGGNFCTHSMRVFAICIILLTTIFSKRGNKS
jgi:hypothetical protein